MESDGGAKGNTITPKSSHRDVHGGVPRDDDLHEGAVKAGTSRLHSRIWTGVGQFTTAGFWPISPPPLRRMPSQPAKRHERLSSTRQGGGSPASSRSESVQTPNLRLPQSTPSKRTSVDTVRTTPTNNSLDIGYSVADIADYLRTCQKDVRDNHAQLTGYILSTSQAVDNRVLHGEDLFANVRLPSVPEKKGTTVRVKSKQHLRSKRDQRETHYVPICTKTNKERVPPYRFHHVTIKKNVLTPNTMLTFVPHLRDLETSEENKYNLWLQELEDIDLKSGFNPMNREDKQMVTIQGERAAMLSLYLDSWLEGLRLQGCNRSALISYMARREPDDAITPQQKSDILRSHRNNDSTIPGANKAAQVFTDAFQEVFGSSQPQAKRVDLRKVLMFDESVDNIMEAKPVAKDAPSPPRTNEDSGEPEDEDKLAETNLGTYCILGCLICFSHACDHGEYDNKNMKRTFSVSSCSRLSDALKRRRKRAEENAAMPPPKACRRLCYLRDDYGFGPTKMYADWSEDQDIVLRSMYVTTSGSSLRSDPICMVAQILNRNCEDVYARFQALNIKLPAPGPPETVRLKNLSWYDRRRKVLLGDWQDHTTSHEHQRRENLEPCSHEGPCAPRICPCVDADVLCEKFCGCTVENCSYKFTGCGCHSQGKSCQQKQKDKPCICVQLNRECDPQLCGSCGVLERADPLNADDGELHATGCQNCDLQRGVGKAVVLGRSQLEGVGYGLFTAENIAQDEFIIEYVGELISHDEGVRREARRGDVFDEEANSSYVFTLLENEGIWVDAAIYGNLSRYINHASEHDRRGCNITPRILYVNGEYRIKFTAMRDIAAGEELFFNYGENFPNLTKNLLDTKASGKSARKETKTKPKRGGSGVGAGRRDEPVVRKATNAAQKRRPGRPRVQRDLPPGFALEAVVADAKDERMQRSLKRKRRQAQADSDSEEYEPEKAGTPLVSGGDSDKETGSASRLRRRHTLQGLPETPTRATEFPKKSRGKRGGARPGSGRPRKYPRPPPKAPDDVAEDYVSAMATPAPLGMARKTVSTSDLKRASRRSEPEIVTIPDSDESPALDDARRTRQPPQPKARRSDDEDDDIVVRNRNERTPRARRPPAKFRDDDMWT